MEKTKTSSFGTGKRESHDSSTFYERSLYEGFFAQPLSDKDLKSIEVPPVEDWADKIYNKSSEQMSDLPSNSIALAFTSPPYNVGKNYDDDMSLQEYLQLIRNAGQEIFRVLRPGGRYVINIANLGRKPYIPLHAFFYDIHMAIGFLPMGEIIWQKAKGASNSCAWGSWLNASAPRLRDVHEYLLVFAKQSFSRPDKGESNISPTEFMDATLSIWDIQPESAKRVGHPAPFPVALAQRVIELYTYEGDVVLDPFVGSGSTCVAADRCKRHYVGYDISKEYCNLSELRIMSKGKLYMPSAKTECSELSLGFGILGIDDPSDLPTEVVEKFFENSLSADKYMRFQKEFNNSVNHDLYTRLKGVGNKLRLNYPLFNSIEHVQWRGPFQQATTSSAANDLLVANTPVSVKAGSNLVLNTSPYNIFNSVPKGVVFAQNSENWFQKLDAEGFQGVYSYVRDIRLDHFPDTVAEFEQTADKQLRKELQAEISKLDKEHRREFDRLYWAMCRQVADESAKIFNTNVQDSMDGGSKNAVLEYFMNKLFRLDTTEYILAGVDKKEEFAVVVPDITKWKKNWEIVEIRAIPDLKRKQSIVYVNVSYRARKPKITYVAKFEIQIRWSHGKFCGVPEAKLYKRFDWSDISFMTTIV